MNYELAKQLKDAGFPQGNASWIYPDNVAVGIPAEPDDTGVVVYLPAEGFIEDAKAFIHQELERQAKEIIDSIDKDLGCFVSSPYRVEDYDDKAISPRDFWHKWEEAKEQLRQRYIK